MKTIYRLFLLGAVLATLIGRPGSAVAAAAPAADWTSVDITLQSETDSSLLLVSGELPSNAALPYETELAVPAGTELQWIGEILGGDPQNDPELQYVKSSANGMDVYRFTLTKARIAQIEGVVPTAVTFDGTNYSTALAWTAWKDVPQVRISQRVPQGAQIVQPDTGASVSPGATGWSYYTKTVKNVKAGTPVGLSFSYTLPAVAAANSGAAGSATDNLVLMMIVLVFIGGGVLMAMSVKRKMDSKQAASQPAPVVRAEKRPEPKASSNKSKHSVNPEPVAASAPKRARPQLFIYAVVGVLVLGFVIAGLRGTTATTIGGTVSRSFGASSACQSATVAVVPNSGVDLAKQGDKLLASFEGMEGVGEVTIDVAQSAVELNWCESSQSEETMRQALSSSGLVTLGQAGASTSAPASATIDPSGKKQALAVGTETGSFSPSQIVLKAGVPAELSFGEAAGCLSEVVIESLGINQDLTKGAATVQLPALEAGTYRFACAMGHKEGQIVVQ